MYYQIVVYLEPALQGYGYLMASYILSLDSPAGLQLDMWNLAKCSFKSYIDGLVQERCNSCALAMELHLSSTNPSISLYCVLCAAAGGVSQEVIQARKEEVWRHMDPETQTMYGRDYLDKIYNTFESSIPSYPSDLTPVVRALRSGLLSKRPHEKYTVGRGAGTLLTLFPVLPLWLADHLSSSLSMVLDDCLPIGAIRWMNGGIHGLAQDCSNSSSSKLELLQSCTKPSK